MSSGLFALLDDVAAIAKVAAATLDDVAAQTVKAGSKAAGIVIDDAAVTPRYVVGFASDRELPIVVRIAWGSLKNKLIFLLPAALLLSALAPWAITPLLMAGGLFLAYEGYEKVLHLLHPAEHAKEQMEVAFSTAKEVEDAKVGGAIRTDMILSAEIMAIALATIDAESLFARAVVLALVGIAITIGVYGAVALIVKADDIGAAMARGRSALGRAIGRGLVLGMPGFLSALSVVGTVAMLWVGGGIIVHGLAQFGLAGPEHLFHDIAHAVGHALGPLEGIATWLTGALLSAAVGLVLGWIVVLALGIFARMRGKTAAH
jgi:predicted DNA repair protein MutK